MPHQYMAYMAFHGVRPDIEPPHSSGKSVRARPQAAERQETMNTGLIIRIIAAILLYAIIDIIWNILPPVMGMYASLHAASGSPINEIAKMPQTDWGMPDLLGVLAFFILIGAANAYLAIEPAIKQNSLARAMKNSALLGAAAYATYIAPLHMTIKGWPGILVPIDILIGLGLSLITSTIITAIALNMRNRQ